MSVTLFFACLAWIYLGMCVISICLRIHVYLFPLKWDAEMRSICSKRINWEAALFLLVVTSYALWYKWGF